MSVADRYSLRRPCLRCPFRTDVPGYLRRGRAVEIATAIAKGAEFACHQTTVPDPNDDNALRDDPHASKQCAGALIVMEKAETPNQAARVAERIGLYDRDRMDLDAPVFDSLAAFVAHHGEDEDDDEDSTCSICDAGCLAPAGMLVGGHAVPVEAEGPVHACPECGDPVCENCSTGDGVCRCCADWDESEAEC